MTICRFLLFLSFVSLLGLAQSFAAAGRECSSLFQSTVVKIQTAAAVSSLVADPLKFEGNTLKFAESLNKFPEPFHVRGVSKLPAWLLTAVKDIHILARSPELREDVFGSSTSNRFFTTKPRNEPLNLASNDRRDDYPAVEVGLDVFTLSGGERVYFYHTSNHRANIVSDYEFYLGLMDSLPLNGRKIVALDSFHTHPVNLLITRDDRSFFQTQLQQIRAEHPAQSFENWTMSTTMEAEPVVHTVNLRKWLKQ